jgi:DNA-binding MarR family transcriptional regulator
VPRRDRPSPEALAAWAALLRTHLTLVNRLDDELIERHSLPLAWYDVLVQLNEAGGDTTMGVLADRLLIRPSACTRLVERMAAAGFVERTVDEGDRRIRHARITPAGRSRLATAAVTHLAGIERHFARFVSDQEASLIAERFDAMTKSDGSPPPASTLR